ncbi:MAG TPA: MoaD/ThiS family protein [Allosphingosinicella sp.]|nr:MoaD/ThiS family protein [Allosphingosinicella sp.]
MTTKVLFFGRLAEALGKERIVALPAGGCTVGELKRLIGRGDPAAAEALGDGSILAAVDQAIVADDTHVPAGSEIAFLSPLSGG